jgi:hypothetical protein
VLLLASCAHAQTANAPEEDAPQDVTQDAPEEELQDDAPGEELGGVIRTAPFTIATQPQHIPDAVQVLVTGTYRLYQDRIELDIDSAEFFLHPRDVSRYKYSHVSKLAFGLVEYGPLSAKYGRVTGFTGSMFAEPIEMDFTLEPGNERLKLTQKDIRRNVKPKQLTIRLSHSRTIDLTKHSLMLDVWRETLGIEQEKPFPGLYHVPPAKTPLAPPAP